MVICIKKVCKIIRINNYLVFSQVYIMLTCTKLKNVLYNHRKECVFYVEKIKYRVSTVVNNILVITNSKSSKKCKRR